MKSLTRHFPHYFPLIGIFVAAILGFIIFSYDRSFQVLISIAVAIAYVTWGIIHHYLHHDLYPEVVIEYIIVAALGLVTLFSLIFRV